MTMWVAVNGKGQFAQMFTAYEDELEVSYGVRWTPVLADATQHSSREMAMSWAGMGVVDAVEVG